jgi:hypothetical protein
LADDLNKSANKFNDAAMLAWKEMHNPASKAGQATLVEYFATADGSVGPDGKGGVKSFLKGQSFKRRTSATDMGAQTMTGFSTSRIPEGKKGTSGATASAVLTNYRAAFATGEKVIDKITLPSGQIMPKTGKNIKIYKAVTRTYARAMKKLKKEVGPGDVGPGDASLAADTSIEEVLSMHRSLRADHERFKAAKYNKKKDTWKIPGRPIDVTNKQYQAAKKIHAAQVKTLGYVPDFKIKFGITKEQIEAMETK